MPTTRVFACAVGLLLAAGACDRAPRSFPVVTVAVPDRINQTPRLAVDGDTVAVVWTAVAPDGASDAYVSVSDAGGAFTAPVRVNDVAGEVRPSEQQAPRVAVRAGLIAVVWTSRRQNATEIRMATSTDHGGSFGASQRISPAAAPGTRGWASLTVDEERRAHIVWLDTRVAAASAATSEAAHAPATTDAHAGMSNMPSMPSTRQDVYSAIVSPDGSVQEQLVATDVCYCCKTAVVESGNDYYAAWRDIYPNRMRDISVAKLTATGSPARVRVSEDRWQIDACPEDGPALAATRDGVVHVVWPTFVAAPDGKGVFFAETRDGQSFTPRVRLDDPASTASHPSLAATSAGVLAAVWEEPADGGRRIEMRTRHNATWRNSQPLTDAGSVASPSVAGLSYDFIAAWSQKDGSTSRIDIQRIDGRR